MRAAPDGRSAGAPGRLLVMALSAVFVAIGLVFLFAPRLGAAIYGLAMPPETGPAYLVAIGLRDLAFGLYLLALSRLASAKALGAVLAVTVLIPVGDVLIVAAERGYQGWPHLLLHAASGAVMAGSAAWLFARSDNRRNGERDT